MKPSLLILAAGAGSRFGGLKQLELFGPNGETIMDYSIYDALKAGFGKVVMIIRNEFLKDFEERFSKCRNQIELDYSFQEVNPKIEGIENLVREKPWGTVHAVLSASEHINEPFTVINADDFYGKESFMLMSEFLKNSCTKNHWSLIGYRLKNTLSQHGGVTRGACETDDNGLLKNVKECREVQKADGEIFYKEGSTRKSLNENTVVSMNFWGFHPHFLELAERDFKKFTIENVANPKAEMTIPDVVQPLIEKEGVRISVLKTNEKWFGVTYREDKESAVNELKMLIEAGEYPEKLWK